MIASQSGVIRRNNVVDRLPLKRRGDLSTTLTTRLQRQHACAPGGPGSLSELREGHEERNAEKEEAGPDGGEVRRVAAVSLIADELLGDPPKASRHAERPDQAQGGVELSVCRGLGQE